MMHAPEVRRIGPGAYRAECLLRTGDDQQHLGCGWMGDLHEGNWWAAKADAEADAARHVGRDPKPPAKGPTPSRPMRISDDLWNPVVEVAVAEGISASEVTRQALAADPRVAARLAAVSACTGIARSG